MLFIHEGDNYFLQILLEKNGVQFYGTTIQINVSQSRCITGRRPHALEGIGRSLRRHATGQRVRWVERLARLALAAVGKAPRKKERGQ